MKELVESYVSWSALLGVVLAFGFLPGFVLRLILKLYPREDPRRQELLAELYAMPRVWRPVWVGQQIETALFEGPPARVRELRRRRHEVDSAHGPLSPYQAVRLGRGARKLAQELAGYESMDDDEVFRRLGDWIALAGRRRPDPSAVADVVETTDLLEQVNRLLSPETRRAARLDASGEPGH